MAKTYDKIYTTTLGSAAAAINFTSIPDTYTDLRWVLSGKLTSTSDIYIRYNSNSSALYSWTRFGAVNSTPLSSATSDSNNIRVSFSNPSETTDTFYICGDVFSYAGSTFKSTLTQYYGNQSTTSAAGTGHYVGVWRGTVAINELNILASGAFAEGTMATLYGILKA